MQTCDVCPAPGPIHCSHNCEVQHCVLKKYFLFMDQNWTHSVNLATFLFCVITACLKYSVQSTRSHCNVWNFAPSISGAVYSLFSRPNCCKESYFSCDRKLFLKQGMLAMCHKPAHVTQAVPGLVVLDIPDQDHLEDGVCQDTGQCGGWPQCC